MQDQLVSEASSEVAPPKSSARTGDPLTDSLGGGGITDPLAAGSSPSDGPEAPPERFTAGGEEHTCWTQVVDGKRVTYIASKPMPVRTRLAKWTREAKRMTDPVMKRHILRLIEIATEKQERMEAASAQEDPTAREAAIIKAQSALGGALGVLFKAFDVVYPGIGASVVYRGLHFTKDWQAKRGRSIAEENDRSFEDVKSDGTYSTASYEIAAALARGGRVERRHLDAATRTVNATIKAWTETTDGNREDTALGIAKKRKALEAGIEKFEAENKAQDAAPLKGLREDMDGRFTTTSAKFKSQFEAALSRYIDQQSRFESELSTGSAAGYKDVDFTGIPFISTSKSAKAAVEYAEGKLAANATKSTAGTIGRVLIYAAPSTALMEAGGIDVWAGLKAGTLTFTTYRKNENEITFTGSIPDEFLRGMTPVTAEAGTSTNTGAAELEASKRAAAFGGLVPLPLNKD